MINTATKASPKVLLLLSILLLLFGIGVAIAFNVQLSILTLVVFVSMSFSIQFFILYARSQRSHDATKKLLRDNGFTRTKQLDAAMVATNILFNRFKISYFPITTYSMSPINLSMLVQLLDMARPNQIVELGSGLTTMIIGTWLKEQGQGRLLSIEHQESWMDVCGHYIESNQIGSCVTLHHAPLVSLDAMYGQTTWYDLSTCVDLPESIDFLIVDGPPEGTSVDSRLPAMEKFYDRLCSGAYILLDDGVRAAEQNVVSLWRQRWPNLQVEYYPSLTGLFAIKKP